MAEEEKQQVGDGADNYGQAASQMAKAAGQSGQAAAKQAGKEAAILYWFDEAGKLLPSK